MKLIALAIVFTAACAFALAFESIRPPQSMLLAPIFFLFGVGFVVLAWKFWKEG